MSVAPLENHLLGTPFAFKGELGRGAMGIVLDAVEKATGAPIAVKIIVSDGLLDPSFVDRVRLETELLQRGRSPHFVAYKGAGANTKGHLWVAMERLAGRTLMQEIRARGRLSLEQVLTTGIQVLDGLAEAQRLGAVHRDLKPENVFLCDGSDPKLVRILDFGFAKVVAPNDAGPAPLAVATSASYMLGSLRWAAPEVIRKQAVDARTDIYSLGLVLWSMATGSLPWPAASEMGQLVYAQLQTALPSVASPSRADEYGALDVLIARMTEKTLDRRPPNVEELARDLRRLLAERCGMRLDPVALGGVPRLEPTIAHRRQAAARGVTPPIPSVFPRLSAGEQFERRYEIVEPIGHGGVGVVYRAKHLFLGREVALKLIPLEAKYVSDARERFSREMQALARVHHRHVVQIFDGGVTDAGVAYIVMELLDGVSLRSLLKDGRPLDDLRACHYLGQIAEGLRAIHAVPILHRDIKPDNVVVQRDGVAKIVDFGLARVRTQTKHATFNQHAMGTIHYMPKEQLDNRPLDESVDVFAFGLVMFECFVGSHVRATTEGHFQNRTEAIRSVMEDRPLQPLGSRRADLPREIVGLWERCVAFEPAKRPKAAEIVAAFEGFVRWAHGRGR